VIDRPIRYPPDWPTSRAQEKGVDVALAVDLVVMAVQEKFDVGVVASTDTDLRPALEFVLTLPGKTVEVVAWQSARPLSIEGKHIWCHRMSRGDYDLVEDTRDYNIK